MRPWPRAAAVASLTALGAVAMGVLLTLVAPAAAIAAPFGAGLLMGAALSLPAAAGVAWARSTLNRLSIAICLACLLFPLSLAVILQPAPLDLWTGFRIGLPISVPWAFAMTLAHQRVLWLRGRSSGLRFRGLSLSIYLGYGAAALVFPWLHFEFKEVNFSAPLHVLLIGGGATHAISQALAMSLALSIRGPVDIQGGDDADAPGPSGGPGPGQDRVS
jgi:hypothetical protein